MKDKLNKKVSDKAQSQPSLLGAVSGSFLSNLEHRMNEILFSGLDITMLKFNEKDGEIFKSELKELSGIDISFIKTYKNIITGRTNGVSKIVAMDKFRDNCSRCFNMNIGDELP